jgi:hypothetical protein
MADRIAEAEGALGLRRAALRAPALAPGRALAVALAGGVTALLVFAVQAPLLRFSFFGDDFVALADISSRSAWGYVRDLFLLRDLTPNWRFLSGLFYLGAYRSFGLDAMPYLVILALLHSATAALCFWLVWRVTGAVPPAMFAGVFFGVTAAHVPTVAYVTAAPHVMAGFLLVLALAFFHEALTRDRRGFWAASVLCFAGAVAANEGAAVLAPAFGFGAAWRYAGDDGWWRDRTRVLRIALLSVPFAAIGVAAIVTFGACQCTEAGKEGIFAPGTQMNGNLWIYLGRLLWPIGIEPPGEVGAAHLGSGIAVAIVALVMLARGPALARFAAAFLALALVPQLPANWVLAPRYVYLGAIPFAVLAALVFAGAARYGARLAPALPALVAAAAVGVLGVSAWQAWEQNEAHGEKAAHWRELVDGLEARYADLPEGSRVYVRGGPLTDSIWQFYVLPSVGEVLWGGVAVFSPPAETEEFCRYPGDGAGLYLLDYDGGRYTPVPVEDAPNAQPPAVPGALPARAIDCPTPSLP